MEEEEVVKAVKGWLEGQGFRVYEELPIDESGRPGPAKRPDLSDPEKHVASWARAHAVNGVSLIELEKGLADLVPREKLREAVAHLVNLGEVEVRQGRVHLGPFPHGGSFVIPSQIRPDLVGLRGRDTVVKWSVECKGSRGNIAHGLGQAFFASKVNDKSFLAIPTDWPKIYDGPQKAEAWSVLRRLAHDLGFHLLGVQEDGKVRES